MVYVLDTNILHRLARPANQDHLLIREALRKLRQNGDVRSYLPQNLVEFWNVCTRPQTSRGGFGLSIAETDRAARLVERVFTLIPDNPAVHTEWRRLVVAHGVNVVQVHDARIVAAMNVHGITHILTRNPRDFARFPGIVAVHPSTL